MIVAGAVVPTAPLLVAPGTTGVPDALGPVAAATTHLLATLPRHDLAILIAPGPATAAHRGAEASLAGIGRPDLCVVASVHPVEGLPRAAGPLPLGLTVLVHLYARAGGDAPVVPVAVDPCAQAEALVGAGAALADAVGDRRAVVLASGDLSAGLTERAPLALVEGAEAWDGQVVDAVASGRLDRLAWMGPGEARRVGALGWAPLVVLHGICERARLGTMVRRYAAPRGVGYLVARVG